MEIFKPNRTDKFGFIPKSKLIQTSAPPQIHVKIVKNPITLRYNFLYRKNIYLQDGIYTKNAYFFYFICGT